MYLVISVPEAHLRSPHPYAQNLAMKAYWYEILTVDNHSVFVPSGSGVEQAAFGAYLH